MRMRREGKKPLFLWLLPSFGAAGLGALVG